MKEKLKKVAKVCKVIFGYGIMISVFVGGLTFFGYIAALVIGGDTAELICDFLYNKVLKTIIYVANIMIAFGLFSMYLAGEKSLTPTKTKKAIEKAKSE